MEIMRKMIDILRTREFRGNEEKTTHENEQNHEYQGGSTEQGTNNGTNDGARVRLARVRLVNRICGNGLACIVNGGWGNRAERTEIVIDGIGGIHIDRRL